MFWEYQRGMSISEKEAWVGVARWAGPAAFQRRNLFLQQPAYLWRHPLASANPVQFSVPAFALCMRVKEFAG
jgi:hypothetical protein